MSGFDDLHVLGFNGSVRKGSWNRKLMRAALSALERAGASTSEFDLRPIPMYDWDHEQEVGLPEPVIEFKKAISDADALLVASPEYNNSFSGVIKNAIEWACRNKGGNPFPGKPATIIGASNGDYGAARMHVQLSYVLAEVGAMVMPAPRLLVPRVKEVMTEDGRVTADWLEDSINELASALVRHAAMLSG